MTLNTLVSLSDQPYSHRYSCYPCSLMAGFQSTVQALLEELQSGKKVGSFEWIASYAEIRPYCDWFFGSREQQSALNALEIGCGTSSITEDILRDYPFVDIVGIDYDAACISHLRQQHPQHEKHYQVYDMLAETDSPPDVLFDYYDFIIDKGTYDAILVEGSVVQMLRNVHRLLRCDGCYLLFSIHPVDFLRRFFATPTCGLTCLRLESMEIEGQCSVMLLRKNDESFDEIAFAAHEHDFLDRYYQDEQPLLTAEEEARIRRGFQSTNERLSLREAHSILFDPLLEYDYALFREDLQRLDPPLESLGSISVEEALRFMREMQ